MSEKLSNEFNKILVRTMGTILLATIILSSTQVQALTRSEEKKVAVKLNAIINRYMKSYAKENILMAMGSFAKEPVLYWSSGLVFKGTTGARESLLSAYKEMDNFQATWTPEEYKIKYDMGIVVGTLTWTALHVATQKVVQRKVRSTFVFIREFGKWKVWHEHSSMLYKKK